MADNNKKYISWEVPEYHRPQRSTNWYIFAGIFVLVILFLSFFSINSWHLVFLGPKSNFLFALIIIMALAIIIIHDSQEPQMVKIKLGQEGVNIGRRFYDYDNIKNFCVLYKPKQSIKNLYFEFNNKLMPRLDIALRRQDPLEVRNFLAQFLDEDLERTSPPLSERLTKWLKL